MNNDATNINANRGKTSAQSKPTARQLLDGVRCPKCDKPSLSPWQRTLGERAVEGVSALITRAATIAITGSDILGTAMAYGPMMDALSGTDGAKCESCGITLDVTVVFALVQMHQEEVAAQERREKKVRSMKVSSLRCPHCSKDFRLRHLFAPRTACCPGCHRIIAFTANLVTDKRNEDPAQNGGAS